MFAKHHARLSVWLVAVSAAVALSAACPESRASAAEDLDKLDTSLKLIPANASFYSSMMRGREQFEAVRNSNAWTKIAKMPVLQMALAEYNAQAKQADTAPAKIEAALANPEIRKIVDLATDMASEEVFVYGDESFVDFFQLAQNLVGAMRYGPAVLQITGQTAGETSDELQAKVLMAALAQNIDHIALPNLVVGFKLKNTDLAKEQLIKLEAIANILLESNDKTKGRFKKTKVGNHEYLVLEFDGGMLPWDEFPLEKAKEAEAAEGDADKLVDRLKQAKLVIALGVRENYLLAAIGSSTDCIKNLGGGDRLIDRPEFKPLAKHAGQRLTSISYLSETMNRLRSSNAKNIDDLLELVDELLPLANLSEEQSERVRKDAEALAGDVKKMIPEVGATMAVGFLTSAGIEGYQYTWGGSGKADASKPLSLLKHVGGAPAMGVVARQKVSSEDYDRIVKWVKVGYGYFEEFGLPNVPEDDREKVAKFLEDAIPLVKRMDTINREMLIPALSDGQSALVFDAKLKSKHFIKKLPATEKEMPMIEPALVVGVSDAKLLRKALGEYRQAINDLIDLMRKTEGSEVPAWLTIPAPEAIEGESGALFTYKLPDDWGVDEQIGPYLGLGNDVAVLAASRGHAERLLKESPLSVGGLLANTDRPLAAAVWLNWAAMIDDAKPWIDVASNQIAASQPQAKAKDIIPQVHTVVEVLQTVRAVTSEIYAEDGAMVNHTLMEIRDVEK